MFTITNPAVDPAVGSFPPITQTDKVLQLYLSNFLRIGFIAGSVIALFMLLVGALEYITAGGEKDKTSNAAKRITNALIGIAILLSIFAISRLVTIIFGIDLLKLNIPTII